MRQGRGQQSIVKRTHWSQQTPSSNNTREDLYTWISPDGQYQNQIMSFEKKQLEDNCFTILCWFPQYSNVKIPHFFKHLEHRYSIPYQFYYYGLWSYMSIKYYFCIYSLVKCWLLGACSSLIVSYSVFFFFFFAMPLGFSILVPQPGLEPGDSAVKRVES